jgi:hypothetical protein
LYSLKKVDLSEQLKAINSANLFDSLHKLKDLCWHNTNEILSNIHRNTCEAAVYEAINQTLNYCGFVRQRTLKVESAAERQQLLVPLD